MSYQNASTLADRVDALEMVLHLLSEKDRKFAQDLISGKWGYRTKKTLSHKQAEWVDELTKRAVAPKSTEPKPVAQVGGFQKVYDLFAAASKKLRFPKIRLQVGEQPVVLAVAGQKSSQPGVVNVTDGGPFGANKWFGRVATDGSWQQGKSYPETAEVAKLLQALADDPVKTAREYGKLTGACCFCGLVLTDKQSVAAGFGETCAKNYGLLKQYKEAESLLAA